MGYVTDGAGASVFGGNPSTYYAMRNYFLFRNDMSQVYPENYSTTQYRNILQNDLNNNKPILGANDGGSGVGVLLEIARIIQNNPITIGLDIILFDAEDHGNEGDINSWCLGSQYW